MNDYIAFYKNTDINYYQHSSPELFLIEQNYRYSINLYSLILGNIP
jgi:hypothetical protein